MEMSSMTVVWQDRLVKLHNARCLMMSRVGDHADWEFEKVDAKAAIAFSYGAPITGFEALDENRFLVVSGGVYYVCFGNPMDQGTVDELENEVAARAWPGRRVAAKAFDVMVRRRWHARLMDWPEQKWTVMDRDGDDLDWPACAADPFTALVEADAWYKANVENPQ